MLPVREQRILQKLKGTPNESDSFKIKPSHFKALVLNSDLFSNVAVPFTLFFETVPCVRLQREQVHTHWCCPSCTEKTKCQTQHSYGGLWTWRSRCRAFMVWFWECCSCIDLVSTVPMTRVLHICFIRCIPSTPSPCEECRSRVMSQYVPIQVSWMFRLRSHFQTFRIYNHWWRRPKSD